MATDNLLIELGTEELPPKSLSKLQASFAAGVNQALQDAELGFSTLKSYATPRRLALLIEGLVDRQPDQNLSKRGPAVKAAFDDEGNPTKALQGFMRGCDISDPKLLDTETTEKGDYLVYRATQQGQTLVDLLPEIIAQALAKLPIDRRMRWGKRRVEFVRPMHWLVCLYGSEVLPVNILNVEAGRTSRGHRFMSDGEFDIANANDYVEACRTNRVIVDFDERRDLINTQINKIAADLSAQLESDDALLDEVTALVEWPVALAGGFDETFLAVPPEVLISAMKEHQRYFHLIDGTTNELMPRFITVSNIESSDPAAVIAGNERVIRPRLADAAFFFEKDTKTGLEANLQALQQVVFQTELGSYGDKALRIGALAKFTAAQLSADVTAAERAGQLAKADLVSDMVLEFPDLQGTMGGYYANQAGESADIVDAISQHYRPSYSGGPLPDGPVASAVAISDKLDTLVGLFGIDQPPTGSRDPFALRRQSLGVIRICIENDLDLDLADCLEQAATLYAKDFNTDAVTAYIIDRLKGYYSDMDITGDVVDAATQNLSGKLRLNSIDQTIRALMAFKSSDTAEQIIAANKRVANILKKVEEEIGAFDASLAENSAETDLAEKLSGLDLSGDVDAQLVQLASLQAPVDRFFDDVMVMADDPKQRANRLALLASLRNAFLNVADFSLLQ